MEEIVRLQPSELAEELLRSQTEVETLSPLEKYDNSEDNGEGEKILTEITQVTYENHLEEQKTHSKIKTLKGRETEVQSGKSDNSGFERNQR